jgi:L-ascorbate metabolism protein UlaG (beta-lactamase superfamily)
MRITTISFILIVLLIGCSQAGTTSTLMPTLQATATTDPFGLQFIAIPEQITSQDDSFFPLNVYKFLRYQKSTADKMTWIITGSENLAANINNGVATITLLNPAWQGSETIHVEGCEPSGACAAQDIVFTVVAPSVPRITYTCNDGFIINAGGEKILIDVLYRESYAGCQDAGEAAVMASSQPPFGEADLVLVTHEHKDHFEPQVTGSYLQTNPEAQLVTMQAVADILQQEFAGYDQIQGQVHIVQPADGQRVQMAFDGIDLEAMLIPADVPNLGFLIRIGDYTFFHSGDSGDAPEITSIFQSYQLQGEEIDVAFLPFWYLTDPKYLPVLESIQARDYVPMHFTPAYGQADAFEQVPSAYPEALLFTSEMQTMTYPSNMNGDGSP